MSLLDDILAKEDQALAKAKANTDALSAVKALLDSQNASIAALKAALDAAGTDPVKLQAVSDAMDGIIAQADTQAAAEAALTDTSGSPVPSTGG